MKPKVNWKQIMANIERISKAPRKEPPLKTWRKIKVADGYDPIIEAEERWEIERENEAMGMSRGFDK